jgi:acyl-CoA synthetase (AMP-forming)/AMP-acid ligase II
MNDAETPVRDNLSTLADAQGEKMAVIEDLPSGKVREWRYAELEANANRLGRVLMDHGVQPRDKIIWCGQNSPWIVALIHAARKVGAVAVPLNYRLTAEEAAYVVDNSDAVLVFADAEFAELFAAIRTETQKVRSVLLFDVEDEAALRTGQLNADPLIAAADPSELVTGVEPGAAGTMIYTSGTTGKPKGAVRESAGDPTQTLRMIEVYGLRRSITLALRGSWPSRSCSGRRWCCRRSSTPRTICASSIATGFPSPSRRRRPCAWCAIFRRRCSRATTAHPCACWSPMRRPGPTR